MEYALNTTALTRPMYELAQRPLPERDQTDTLLIQGLYKTLLPHYREQMPADAIYERHELAMPVTFDQTQLNNGNLDKIAETVCQIIDRAFRNWSPAFTPVQVKLTREFDGRGRLTLEYYHITYRPPIEPVT